MRIIIYGANDIGCLLAVNLFEDHDVTVVDKEENRLEDFDKLDISFVYGSGTNASVLENAQIKDSDIFIACTNNDEKNLVACYAAKRLSQVKTVCDQYRTAHYQGSYNRLQTALNQRTECRYQ